MPMSRHQTDVFFESRVVVLQARNVRQERSQSGENVHPHRTFCETVCLAALSQAMKFQHNCGEPEYQLVPLVDPAPWPSVLLCAAGGALFEFGFVGDV